MTVFKPSYRLLFESGELAARVEYAVQSLGNCQVCPRNCAVDRLNGKTGDCGIGRKARVYSFMPHHGEENPLRGRNGSGTIFFSGCNMHCVYCQNAEISQERYGLEVEAQRLAEMMLSLQEQGCHNINLVSPTHIISQILEGLLIAASDGLSLPIVYNTGGYDKVSTLQLLEGIVDIYMPDMKYADTEIAEKLSGVINYPAVNQRAVKEMHRQVGDLKLNEKGVAEKGLLIRHLVLPDGLSGTGEIISFITNEISKNTYLNLMDQYRPEYHAMQFRSLSRRISQGEYLTAVKQALGAGIKRLD